MKPDTYTKAVLTVIAILLAVIAFRPTFALQPVHAAAVHKYAADSATGDKFQDLLDKYSANGWEVVTAWASSAPGVNNVVFKK